MDCVEWKLTTTGTYSVSSLYNQLRTTGQRVLWDNIIWSVYIPPKYSFCLWLLWWKSLKTKNLLLRRGMTIDTTCSFCQHSFEDIPHLFFDCQFTGTIWRKVMSAIGIVGMPTQWDAVRRWLHRNAKGKSVRARTIKTAFSCTAYHVWQERNLRIFQQKSRSIDVLYAVIMQFCFMLRKRY